MNGKNKKTKKRRGFYTLKVEDFHYKDTGTSRLFYYILGFLLLSVFTVCWKFQISGKKNLPKNNHCIYVSNHLSHFDSFAISFPLFPKQPFHYIADEKLFRNKYFSWFALNMNVFPVRKGSKQLSIVNHAAFIVSKGATLLWYVEGQRHKQPWLNKTNQGKIGTGILALKVKVPIIPVFVSGTEFAMPVGKTIGWGKRPRSIPITIKFGKPVQLDDLRKQGNSKNASKVALARILASIESLRPKGPYIFY